MPEQWEHSHGRKGWWLQLKNVRGEEQAPPGSLGARAVGTIPRRQRVVACSGEDKDCGWIRSGGDKKTKMGGRKGSGLNRKQHPLWDSSLQSSV